MKNNYHIYTDEESRRLLYRDVEDFICGMNDVPACLLQTRADLLCFCLMPNHVHFVLSGTRNDCALFVREFRKRTLARLKERPSPRSEGKASRQPSPRSEGKASRQPSPRLEAAVNPVMGKNLLTGAIAYVLRNPLVAKRSLMPTNYPWSSCGLYFRGESPEGGCRTVGEVRKAGEDEKKALRALCKERFPNDYRITPAGYIDPSSYVDTLRVEREFVLPGNFLRQLSANDDTAFEITSRIVTQPTYSTEEISDLIHRTCFEIYSTRDLSGLDLNDLFRIGVLLERRHNVPLEQYAEVIGISPALLLD